LGIDFVSDALFDGRRFRALTVLDHYTPECLDIVVDQSLRGEYIPNALVESFNGRLRQECPNEHWFLSLTDARSKIAAWRHFYNEEGPHSAPQWQTPAEFARQHGAQASSQEQ